MSHYANEYCSAAEEWAGGSNVMLGLQRRTDTVIIIIILTNFVDCFYSELSFMNNLAKLMPVTFAA